MDNITLRFSAESAKQLVATVWDESVGLGRGETWLDSIPSVEKIYMHSRQLIATEVCFVQLFE